MARADRTGRRRPGRPPHAPPQLTPRPAGPGEATLRTGRPPSTPQYAANAAQSSEAAHRKSHDISERFAFGQPILVGHHSEGRARRDHARMDDAMRKSISDGDRAAHWSGRAQAAANYQEFKKDPGRTLRRLDKLRADLRAVEKWQRGQSAKGFSRSPADPELAIERQELTEEIAHWEKVIEAAEAEGFKVWSRADFKRGDFVLYRGTWYEVLRVNPKSVTIPHIHNSPGRSIVRATGNQYDDWTWTAPYDGVSGRKSADEMQQPPQAPATEAQEQAEQSPVVEEPVSVSEPTAAATPAAWANWPDGMALVLIASKNSPRRRKHALWAMTRREAQAVCGDPRTSGRSYMLTWTDQPGTEGADWEWVEDNGSHAPVLNELGITARREWAAAPQTQDAEAA